MSAGGPRRGDRGDHRAPVSRMPRPGIVRSAMLAALVAAIAVAMAGPVAADAYPRQPGVDVERYVFALELGDTSDRIAGDAVLDVRFRASGIEELFLDLVGGEGSGMSVTSVESQGAMLDWEHSRDRLRIELPAPSTTDELRRFRVAYSGVPEDGLIIADNLHGDRTFFGDNWPNRARHWLPTVDHVSDKARVEFRVVAPARYQVVANGRLVKETDLGDGRRLTRWATDAPLATKLMVVGVARFAVRHAGRVAGVPLSTWVYPEDREEGFRDLAVAARALDVFSTHVGPFAYAKLANVQSKTRYGGMENAGAIFYSETAVAGDRDIEGLVAHEIAHQWFGDAVTEADWHHVWLSEGFATYLTQLYMELVHGRDRLERGMRDARERVLEYAAEHPDAPVVDESITDLRRLLSANSYQKGAWALHMLRRRVGDEAFWDGVRAYYHRHLHGNARTADFRRVMEEIAGRDLSGFFEQWIFRPGHPVLAGSWSWDADAGRLRVTLEQRQDGPPLRFPLELAVEPGGDEAPRVETVQVENRRQVFELEVDRRPDRVVLDPDVWLLFEDAGFDPTR